MSDPLCSCVYQSVFWQARLQSSDLLLVLVEDAESTLHGQVTRYSDLDPLPSEAAATPSFRFLAFGSTQSCPLLTSRLLGDGDQDPPGVLVYFALLIVRVYARPKLVSETRNRGRAVDRSSISW